MSKGDLVRFIGLTVVVLGILTLPLVGQDTGLSDTQTTSWPQWRGPLATGVSPTAEPPTEWSETKNIRWKVELPGYGSASPIVWDDHIFILSAIPAGAGSAGGPGLFGRLRDRLMGAVGVPMLSSSEVQQFTVSAYDRRDGSVVWERVAVSEQPHEGRHATGSWASASAVTDGEVLCAFFGSRGLYCYDLEGTLLWDQDFGDMEIRMGLEKVRLQPCTVIPLWWCGIIRASHLSRRSTSGRGKSVGGLHVKRLRHGRPHLLWTTKGALRS